MTAEYSAHPALASAQLQRAEAVANNNSNNTNNNSSSNSNNTYQCQSQHRRHNSANSSVCSSSGGLKATKAACKTFSTQKSATQSADVAALDAAAAVVAGFTAQPLPDRTLNTVHASDADDDDGDEDDDDDDDICRSRHRHFQNVTAPPEVASIDEPDHVQHRFSRTAAAVAAAAATATQTHHHHHNHQHFHHCSSAASCDAGSGFSSAGSTPSVSTTCSPLSTPTRHSIIGGSAPQCCQQQQKTAVAATLASTAARQHQQNHPNHPPHQLPHIVAGCKKLQKFDPRLGPSPYRQLLPIALCILSFATVFSILIVYMDTTEIRHQQFRLNMSRDIELYGVAQDDPQLIAFLREFHMKKYPMHFLKNRDAPTEQQTSAAMLSSSSSTQEHQLNFSEHHELTPQMAHYVSDLVGGKLNGGAVIQSLTGAMGQMMTAPWLAGTLNWAGVIVEPEPRRFFALRKQNARHSKVQVVHACVSPNEHPKEITIHDEEAEVRINSLLDAETSWFHQRVKCFPLYTIMLACQRTEYDLLSLGVNGHELEILQTLPFDKIKISVISIHLPETHENVRDYLQSVTKYLKGKSYKLQKSFGRNYFYQKINSTNRTRKKDILLMKQP